MTNPLTDEVIDKAVEAFYKYLEGAERTTAAYKKQAMRAAAKVIESALAGDSWPKLELWFFRELNESQRLALFSIYGLPTEEIGSSHTHQKRMLRHVLSEPAAIKGKSDE